MPDSVHIPLLGEMNKGTALAGGAAIVATSGYLLWKHSKKKAANQTASSSGAGANAQAASAYGYGAYGYGNNNGFYGYGYGPYGYGGGGGGFYGYGWNSGSPVPQQQQASTNAEWSQYAVTALTQEGYNGQAILAALGLYELGRQVDSNQASIVEAAIAAEGYPPVPGANGYPPAINEGKSSGGGGNTALVPHTVGMSAGEAHDLIVAAGLKPKAPPGQKPKMKVWRTAPSEGTKVKPNSSVWIYTRGWVGGR